MESNDANDASVLHYTLDGRAGKMNVKSTGAVSKKELEANLLPLPYEDNPKAKKERAEKVYMVEIRIDTILGTKRHYWVCMRVIICLVSGIGHPLERDGMSSSMGSSVSFQTSFFGSLPSLGFIICKDPTKE